MRKIFMFLTASAFLCAGIANAQDEAPSLGDVARQARQQKQQKDSQSKDASKAASSKDSATNEASAKDSATSKDDHVITNDQLPHTGLAGDSTHSVARSADPKASDEALPAATDHDGQAEQWKSQILEQKNAIATLQHEIDSVSDSIHYAGANCVANCEAWNEHQKQKQDQVETMKSQLADQQKKLEEMQESARKQGFGSSVYEP